MIDTSTRDDQSIKQSINQFPQPYWSACRPLKFFDPSTVRVIIDSLISTRKGIESLQRIHPNAAIIHRRNKPFAEISFSEKFFLVARILY